MSDQSRRRRSPPQRAGRRLVSSARISRDQVVDLFVADSQEPLRVPIRQEEEDRVPISIDISGMTEEEIEEIRVLDPFLYYSIPSVRNAALLGGSVSSYSSNVDDLEQASNNMPSGGPQVQRRRQSAPAAMAAAAADAAAGFAPRETQVRRRSRISFELSFESMMSDVMEGVDGLIFNDGGVDDEGDEGFAYDDLLDRLSNSRGSRGSSE